MKPRKTNIHQWTTVLIASIWLINGLFCKLLNLVPRHLAIVKKILGPEYSEEFIMFIGFSEILMAIWILTKYQSKINAVTQMTLVTVMNILEFIRAPDLLLWGKLNALFACVFIVLIYYSEFILHSQIKRAKKV